MAYARRGAAVQDGLLARHSSIEQIGNPIAELQSRGYRLAEPPKHRWRKFAGTPRARHSDIRRLHAADCPMVDEPPWRNGPDCTCGKKARTPFTPEEKQARRHRRSTHRRHWIMRAIVELMMALPEFTEFSPPEIADRIGASERGVQANLAELAGRRCFERMNYGGRGHLLFIWIDRVALLAFASRLGIRPPLESWRAAMKDGRCRSARLLNTPNDAVTCLAADRKGADSLIPWARRSASETALEPEDRHEPRKGKAPKPPPPAESEVLAMWRRAKHARDPDKRMRGFIGAIRQEAWRHDAAYCVSQMYAEVFVELVAYMGKRSNREAVAAEVFARLRFDREPIPTSRAEIRRWQYDAPQWLANRKQPIEDPPPRARSQRERREPKQLPLSPELQRFAELGKKTAITGDRDV